MSEIDELPADIRTAIEACKEHQAKRDADKPFAPAPGAFLIGACDETLVMMPPATLDADRLTRMADSASRNLVQFYETYFNCTIFWCRGQTEPGITGAVKHCRELRTSGYVKRDLYADAVNSLVDVIDQAKKELTVAPPTAKKY